MTPDRFAYGTNLERATSFRKRSDASWPPAYDYRLSYLDRAWARAAVDDAFDGPFTRRYAVGCAFLRGVGRGRVLNSGQLTIDEENVSSSSRIGGHPRCSPTLVITSVRICRYGLQRPDSASP